MALSLSSIKRGVWKTVLSEGGEQMEKGGREAVMELESKAHFCIRREK